MKISVADCTFEFNGVSDLNKKRYSDYTVSDDVEADFPNITITEKDVSDVSGLDGVTTFADAEAAAIRRKVAFLLPQKNKCTFHGAAFEYKGRGYIFTGASGVGKSTQIRNWQSAFGDEIRVINGDKPAIGMKNGELYIYPTPWNGKEGEKTLCGAPLCGIIILEQANQNLIEKPSDGERVLQLFLQCFLPDTSKEGFERGTSIVRMLEKVPCVKLKNKGDKESAEMLKNHIDGNGGRL